MTTNPVLHACRTAAVSASADTATAARTALRPWLAVALAVAGARVEAAWPPDAGIGVGWASEQVERGFGRSGGRASVLADAYLRWDTGWQASLGVARWPVDAGIGSGEITATLSRHWQADADWTLAATLARYAPTRPQRVAPDAGIGVGGIPGGGLGGNGGGRSRRAAYTQVGLSLGWRENGHLRLVLSPRIYGTSADGRASSGWTRTLEAGWHAPLFGRWSADFGIGHYGTRSLGRPGYRYGSVGVSGGWGPVTGSLGFVTSSGPATSLAAALSPDVTRSRWLASVWWTY